MTVLLSTSNCLHTRLRSECSLLTAFVETVTFLKGIFQRCFQKNLKGCTKYLASPLKQSEEFQDHCPKQPMVFLKYTDHKEASSLSQQSTLPFERLQQKW